MSIRSTKLVTIGLAQIAPVRLNTDATIDRVAAWVEKAAAAGCDLVAFDEAPVPGYLFVSGTHRRRALQFCAARGHLREVFCKRH